MADTKIQMQALLVAISIHVNEQMIECLFARIHRNDNFKPI